MLKLENYKNVLAAVGLVGVLLIASPTLGWLIHLPGGEKFSELWILGPGHMAEDYPFNVRTNESYMVYVGIGNHMGSSAYYVLYVKLRNQTEPLPNSTDSTPSPLAPLYEYRVFVQDGKSQEFPLTFAFPEVSSSENQSVVKSLNINGVTFGVGKLALWDPENRGYYYQLFFELWIYEPEQSTLQFHNRYVGLRLNMTGSE